MDVDYALSGLTIQYAMLDLAKRYPDKNARPTHLLWGGKKVMTADRILVPPRGMVRAEILFCQPGTKQGFDLKVDGAIILRGGERIPLLRTWSDSRYEPVVEYPFEAKGRLLRTWNVYEMVHSGGQVVQEHWTGNAGMWREDVGELDAIYHCSHGMAPRPDFESFVYRVTVVGR